MATLHRVWIVVIGLTILLACSTAWLQRPVVHNMRATALPSAQSTTSVLDSGTPALPARDDDWAEPHVDLNGNEIDDAVSDYRVDGRGEMYERHAPDTSLLRLSAPEL